jgi:queuine tRNA-ribosyltransferase
MAFDECTEHPAEYARTQASMEMTLRWAARSKKYFEEHKHEVPWFRGLNLGRAQEGTAKAVPLQKESQKTHPSSNDGLGWGTRGFADSPSLSAKEMGSSAPTEGHAQSLFGIVQGGMFPDLRRQSAQRTVELDFPGYAIGGLSVGEPRPMTYEMVDNAIRFLPDDKPRYLMGVGTPEEIVHYVAQGVDMMDCVLPTRAARHGLLFTSEGRLAIKNARFADDEGPLDPACGCKVCARYSRAYLRHLYASNELLAQVLNTVHNLAYYLDTMRRVREAILRQQFARFLAGVRAPHLAPESEQSSRG